MEPTIITLGPSADGSNLSVTTFEEAFGEYSEIRGRGRKRRQKRKLSRIEMKAERKRARQKTRAEQQEARQQRKDTKKSRKVARKSMGDTEEETDNQNAPENENGGGGGNDQEQGGGGNDNQNQGGGESQDQGGGESQDQGQDDNWGSGGGGSQDQGPQDQGDAESDAESDGEGDGVMSEDESGFSGELGQNKVSPRVRECAKKIEWNKELVTRLEARRNKLILMLQTEQNSAKVVKIKKEIETINTQIDTRYKRISDLEQMLSTYSNASGRKHAPRRNAEVKHAKRMAQKERAKVTIKKIAKATPQGRVYSAIQKRRMAKHGGSETPVESDLNPEISNNRIEIQAQRTNFDGFGNATGRGIIGLDQSDDFDSGEARIIELKSNADGKTDKKKRNKQILIGVGLGLLIIGVLYYFKKSGVFKKY
jgi:hypothetical protein